MLFSLCLDSFWYLRGLSLRSLGTVPLPKGSRRPGRSHVVRGGEAYAERTMLVETLEHRLLLDGKGFAEHDFLVPRLSQVNPRVADHLIALKEAVGDSGLPQGRPPWLG